jgi:hypothetical protein
MPKCDCGKYDLLSIFSEKQDGNIVHRWLAGCSSQRSETTEDQDSEHSAGERGRTEEGSNGRK